MNASDETLHSSEIGPVSDAEFTALMRNLGNFEKFPTVAVAVSGGPDSMALAVLAHRWVRKRRGGVVALTVDHGLRSGSRIEATEAHRRLSRFGIDCALLVWRGDKPDTGVQAEAREARYRLMAQWCRRHGVLHLLVAHHREDQAETVLHRLARSSGVDGLAGMAMLRELPDVRILRPCLLVPRDRLRKVLSKYKIEWAEDPSNEDRTYARVRLRNLLPVLASEGLNASSLSGTAQRMAFARAGLEADVAGFLSAHAALYPEGYARINFAALMAVHREVAMRVLIALITTIGGNMYPPRQASLTRFYQDIRQARNKAPGTRSRTLGGCRMVSAGSDLLICREVARCENLTVQHGKTLLWDNRFIVRLPAIGGRSVGTCTIAPLGEVGWRVIQNEITAPIAQILPRAVRLALPAILQKAKIVAVPHLGFYNVASFRDTDVQFIPVKPATSASFSVV